jgi:hypothetical protein
MRRTLLFCFLICLFSIANAQWTKVSLAKTEGGTIDANVNQLTVKNNKLYAATADGIFESPTTNGGDWIVTGLQGKKVYLLNFDILKLALTIETASDDATKKTIQLYKFNGNVWENTGFNHAKQSSFGAYPENLINFAQMQNGNDVVIIIPTWGNGIWRSLNGGLNWSQVPYEDHPTNGYQFYRKVPGVYSFQGDNTLYGSDKADFSMQYLISSTDFGATWQHIEVTNFFNPWSFHKRIVDNKSYLYYGGESGNNGALWRSGDSGANWEAAFTMGVPYWNNRRIIGDDNGDLFIMCSADNVYVSKDNGDTFEPVGRGLVFPSSIPKPAGPPLFLTHLIKYNSFLFVSTYNDGIYKINTATTALADNQFENNLFQLKKTDNQLIVNTNKDDLVRIFSTVGLLVFETKTSNNPLRIDIRNLPETVYVLNVITSDGISKTKRFFK